MTAKKYALPCTKKELVEELRYTANQIEKSTHYHRSSIRWVERLRNLADMIEREQ